jgi:transposase
MCQETVAIGVAIDGIPEWLSQAYLGAAWWAHSTLHLKPFIKSNKNDANDAVAICEAIGRPDMYPVKVKTVEQQDLQAMHRIRDEIKSHRIAKANQIRGRVTEYGLVAPLQLPALRRAIPEWLEDADNGLNLLVQAASSRAMGRLVCVGSADD